MLHKLSPLRLLVKILKVQFSLCALICLLLYKHIRYLVMVIFLCCFVLLFLFILSDRLPDTVIKLEAVQSSESPLLFLKKIGETSAVLSFSKLLSVVKAYPF